MFTIKLTMSDERGKLHWETTYKLSTRTAPLFESLLRTVPLPVEVERRLNAALDKAKEDDR